MYTATALLDLHARAHASFARLVALCGEMPGQLMTMPVAGFGFPTILRQLAHTAGAELYWQTVVTRGYHVEAVLPDLSTIAAVGAFRREVAATTRAYLESASEAELNTPRLMTSDPGETRVLRPADVILRIVTHIFHHQGQVLAMCRALGRPNQTADLDYPLDLAVAPGRD